MIILNLIISDKGQVDAVVSSILKNKFSLNVVVGSALNSFYLNPSQVKNHSSVYPIQFVTKSLLFSEIETMLEKEFPDLDFYIYATPAVHINIGFYDKIKSRVTGLNPADRTEAEN